MTDNAQTIQRFYTSFQQRDHAGMAACYHPSVHFSDPAFGDLHETSLAVLGIREGAFLVAKELALE